MGRGEVGRGEMGINHVSVYRTVPMQGTFRQYPGRHRPYQPTPRYSNLIGPQAKGWNTILRMGNWGVVRTIFCIYSCNQCRCLPSNCHSCHVDFCL